MPKVTVGLQLTVQLNEATREFARPYVEISDIDTDGDVDAQINAGIIVAVKAWDLEGDIIFQQIAALSGGDKPELKRTLKAAIG